MKHIHLINRLLLIAATAAGLQAIWDFYQQTKAIALFDFLIMLWMLTIVLVIRHVKLLLIRYACILSIGFILLLTGSMVPAENGLHLLFLPLLCSVFFLFDYKEHEAKIIGGGFILICYLLLEASNFKVFGELPMLEEPDRVSYIINFVACGVLLFTIISYITKNSYNNAKRLQELAQEARQQNEALKQANEELDRFVYSTSHDLRAPLHSLSGLVKIIETKSTTGHLQPYLNMMHDRIQHLEGFITELTHYARNSRMPLKLSTIEVSDLIREVLNNHRYLHQDGAVELRQLSEPEIYLVSDQQRLLIILNNLVSNALKYHQIEQAHPYVAVGAQLSSEQLILWVEDNGPGISDAVKARMFEMFYQGDERSTGSGLGLYIVKEAVEKLGGRIEVESELGRGTIFRVWIPLRKLEEKVVHSQPEKAYIN